MLRRNRSVIVYGERIYLLHLAVAVIIIISEVYDIVFINQDTNKAVIIG